MLRIVARIRPVEVTAVTMQAKGRVKKASQGPSEMVKAAVMLHQFLLEDTKDDPEQHAEIVRLGQQYLYPEERLAGLAPEERLAGLAPEERQKLLELLSQPD